MGAIGARVAKGVTMHGFALNADCDLSWYDRIVPCGIRDAGRDHAVHRDRTAHITVAEVTPVVERHLADVLGYGTGGTSTTPRRWPGHARKHPLRSRWRAADIP